MDANDWLGDLLRLGHRRMLHTKLPLHVCYYNYFHNTIFSFLSHAEKFSVFIWGKYYSQTLEMLLKQSNLTTPRKLNLKPDLIFIKTVFILQISRVMKLTVSSAVKVWSNGCNSDQKMGNGRQRWTTGLMLNLLNSWCFPLITIVCHLPMV